eukprot:TRINITY_DN537_c0_g1_i3.p1 TRINITY_DN537_c0_g1~~TRINITY_DN537_c0_g1_i3.p1  ORF type:complete len:153 (-),score=46.01 TRINITY_DN537_c0_g1_i3:550-1008(-)
MQNHSSRRLFWGVILLLTFLFSFFFSLLLLLLLLLLQQLQYRLSYVDAFIQMPETESGQVNIGLPTLHPVSKNEDMKAVAHQGSFVGDVLLQDLKQLLAEEGIRSELMSGVLVCENGSVKISKKDEQLVFDGVVGETYYQIRDIVYGQYTVV